jgi:hypothetical protein
MTSASYLLLLLRWLLTPHENCERSFREPAGNFSVLVPTYAVLVSATWEHFKIIAEYADKFLDAKRW